MLSTKEATSPIMRARETLTGGRSPSLEVSGHRNEAFAGGGTFHADLMDVCGRNKRDIRRINGCLWTVWTPRILGFRERVQPVPVASGRAFCLPVGGRPGLLRA
jgi:hypothetical protein